MKTTVSTNGLYEALKEKAAGEWAARQAIANDESVLSLDDTERIKILSPGRLVAKRFLRNKLALVGLVILIAMFVFAFAGPLFYPYSQTQLFYKFDYLNTDYASAIERTEYIPYAIPGAPALPATIANRFNSYIIEMEALGTAEMVVTGSDGNDYTVRKLGNGVYTLSTMSMTQTGVYSASAQIATYDRLMKTFAWTGGSMPDDFKDAVLACIADSTGGFDYQGVGYSVTSARNTYMVTRIDPEYSGAQPGEGFADTVAENLEEGGFEFNGRAYSIVNSGGGAYGVFEEGEVSAAIIGSTYVFNAYDVSVDFSDEFKINALFALYGSGEFTAGGSAHTITENDGDIIISNASGQEIGALSTFSIRRYSGQDTLTLDFKEAAKDVILRMQSAGIIETTFVYGVHEIDNEGNYVYLDNGEPHFVDSVITISRKNTGEYVMTVDQIRYLIDIYAAPSSEHMFGTDGDGMDILARMMYGGRVSLMVGFVVVILETIIGVVMGGISGFFSGWVDTLIMRIADVFYCIPTYPILIIFGALFDKLKMDPYKRLIWMMVILGLLGWAGIARLVRGQILSLREQEFMIAQEATGMKARRRIFRHLVPNVMPQLIVTATMGVGSVIIYESTLSFLGLGVKHPLATWGTMINAITSNSENMVKYTYIWIPVGLLICLTVIAFNFVGDGLRDAFDPKMRR